MQNRILKNYIYNAAYQIFCILTPLITAPYVSRVLGATGIGIFSYAQSIASYFVLFGALGGNLYGQREIAYVQNDKDKRTVVFRELILFRFLSVFVASALFAICFCRTGEYKNVFLILLVEVLASAFDISWFFQGIQDFKKSVMRNMIIKTLSILMIFIFVKNENDVLLYTACYAVPVLISNLSLWFYLPKYLSNSKPEKIITLKHFFPLLALFIPQVATDVYTVLDKTMIGVLASSIDEVGYYQQSQKIIMILVRIITALGIVMLPRMSQLYTEHKNQEIQNNVEKSFQFVFALGSPLMFGIISIARNFVPWFFGSGFDSVAVLMSVIAPIILIIGISNVIGKQYLLPTKQQKVYTISVIGGAALNFICNLILIPNLGAVGASVATIVTEAGVTIIQIVFIRKQFPVFKYLVRGLKYFVAAAIMCSIVFMIGLRLSSSIIDTCLMVTVGIAVYFIELLLMKDDIIMTALSKVQKKF